MTEEEFRKRIIEQIESTSLANKEILIILKGQPEYKRKGLVEMVDDHEHIIKNVLSKVGGAIIVLGITWEILKVTVFAKN